MSNEPDDRDPRNPRRELAANFAVAGAMTNPSRFALLEDALVSLHGQAPTVSSLVAQLLADFGEPAAKAIGKVAGKEFGRYDGRAFETGVPIEDVDLLIFTVKDPELEACQLVFGMHRSTRTLPTPDRLKVWIGDVNGLKTALVKIGVAGNTEAALLVHRLATYFRPRLALLLGMAVGVPDLRLGDVVIPNAVYDYQFATLAKDGESLNEARATTPTGALDGFFRDPERVTAWQSAVAAQLDLVYNTFRPGELPPRPKIDNHDPKVSVDPIMAGSWLFEDGSLKVRAAEINNRIVAAEMEGAGFGTACHQLGWNWRVVRGIADWGRPRRNKVWQRYATFTAATYVKVTFPELALLQ